VTLAALAPLLLAPALALGAVAGAETPKIYKWVDSNGIAHYTTDPDRIPKALRNRIQSTRPAPEPVPVPQAEVAPPPPPEPPPALADTAPPAPTMPTAPSAPAAPTVADIPATPTVPDAPAMPAIPDTPARAAEPSVSVSHTGWFDRDAIPRVHEGLLPDGTQSPGQLAALAAEQQALDTQISDVEAAITRDENFLKGLISDPDLDADIPLFDRPDFLEVSKRLPELQTQLDELRVERAKLEPR